MKRHMRKGAVQEFEPIFATAEQRRAAKEHIEDLLHQVLEVRGRLTATAALLCAGLQAFERLAARVEEVFLDGQLALDLDPASDEAYDLFEEGERIALYVQGETSFLYAELRSLSPAAEEAFCEQVPELRRYQAFLQAQRDGEEHALPKDFEEREAELQQEAHALEDAYNNLLFVDMIFPAVELAPGETSEVTWKNHKRLLSDGTNRALRERVYESLFSSLADSAERVADLYGRYAANRQESSRAHRYATMLEGALQRDRLDRELYDGLFAAVRQQRPLLQRFLHIRRRMMGTSDVKWYDLYVPLVPHTMCGFTPERAQDVLLQAVKPLGDAYQEVLHSLFPGVIRAEGLPNSYAANVYNKRPYVLCEQQDSIYGLLTLAHEMGHAVHMALTNRAQPYVYSEVPIVPSELAALVHELLILHYLMEEAQSGSREEAYLLYVLLDKFQNLLFRQTMLAEFEHLVLERVETVGMPTADELTELFASLQGETYGASFVDARSGYDWVRTSHLFNNCYLYAYPIAFAGAVSFLERMDPQAYLDFLAGGCSRTPRELLQSIGVLEEQGHGDGRVAYGRVFDQYSRLLDRFERIMNREEAF